MMDWKQQWPTVAQVKAANPEAFAAALAWVVPEHEFVPPFMLAIVAFIAGYEAREKRSDDTSDDTSSKTADMRRGRPLPDSRSGDPDRDT